MDKIEYTFRDVDHAVLKIFQFLQEKRQTDEGLSEDGKKVFQILEGFLSSDGSEVHDAGLCMQNRAQSFPFEFALKEDLITPEKLFPPKTVENGGKLE
jgi:hypothetical protein